MNDLKDTEAMSDDYRVRLHRAEALAAQGQWSEAEAVCENVIAAFDYPEVELKAYEMLIGFQKAQGKKDEAEKTRNEASDYFRNDADDNLRVACKRLRAAAQLDPKTRKEIVADRLLKAVFERPEENWD